MKVLLLAVALMVCGLARVEGHPPHRFNIIRSLGFGGSSISDCPEGVPVVSCFMDPCDNASCSVRKAECRTNRCGSCTAEWTVKGVLIDTC